jgi:hypothetical protein
MLLISGKHKLQHNLHRKLVSQLIGCSRGTIDSTSAPGYIVHLFTEVGTNFQFSCT